MNRAINYPDAPVRMQELWHWISAIDAWDYKDPAPLAELVIQENIPNELKPIVSKILLGDRKQKRASKIPANERMEIAKVISGIFHMIDDLRYRKVCASYGLGDNSGASIVVAEQKVIEPEELIGKLHSSHAELLENTAQQLGVSVETVENLLRDMRKKIQNWPNV
ncbi:hypothetical protein [Alteromonas sp. R78001]|uniref:hypothetical protein n=1 Tax=Alteromonas sp. R78001 TaxID=3093865 RepID=UPI00367136D8